MAGSYLIYSEHFGLSGRPFSLRPDTDFLYWSANHRRAYSMLEYGLATFAPITVITGEVGAGKTTLIWHLLRSANATLTTGLISNAHRERGKLLHWALSSLKQPIGRRVSYVELFSQFETFLRAEQAAGRHTVLIFDEAQNLSEKMLEELRGFSNINGDRDELLQIVLVGQPELRKTISGPRMVQFSQRVSADFHLFGIPGEVVGDYIAHRLAVVGATHEIFTPAACEIVSRASRGLPRVINQICDYALVYAFAEDLTIVDDRLVRQVLADRRTQFLDVAAISV